MPVKLLCVAGARPNFMKVAPLVRALEADTRFAPLLVHTGQHYDDSMSGQFFRDLGLPEPHYHLEVGSGSHAAQTAEILRRFEPVVLSEQPRAVVVVGDVNSTAGCALVAKKLQVEVVHIEAGLRSFDRSMPEEINRLVTDAITDLFLVTEESGRRNLLHEGVPPSKIVEAGNLMIDSLFYNIDRARQSDLPSRLGVRTAEPYGVVTLHRPANVDNPDQLRQIMAALSEIAATLPLWFPVHPRTRQRLDAHQAAAAGIQLLDPLGPIDFLALMHRAAVVLTDSGGIQEETTALGIPCLTLRENTERPVTIEQGTNRLAGSSYATIRKAWQEHLRDPKQGRVPPLWDGRAAERCRDALAAAYC